MALDGKKVLQISYQLDELFLSEKEIETPLGMDDIKQEWKWADVGSRRMSRSPLTHSAIMVDEGNGIHRPATSQVHHRTLFQSMVQNVASRQEHWCLTACGCPQKHRQCHIEAPIRGC